MSVQGFGPNSCNRSGWNVAQEDRFLEHLRSPYHSGELSGATDSATANHRFCGDRICLQVAFDSKDHVTEAWHNGNGCITSLAAASILCEYIEGKSLTKLQDFSKDDMLALLGIQLTPLRQHCALVAFHALQVILESQREER